MWSAVEGRVGGASLEDRGRSVERRATLGALRLARTGGTLCRPTLISALRS